MAEFNLNFNLEWDSSGFMKEFRKMESELFIAINDFDDLYYSLNILGIKPS